MLRYLDYSMIEGGVYGWIYIPNEHKYGVSVWSKSVDKETELEKKYKEKTILHSHLGQNALDSYISITDFMSQKVMVRFHPNLGIFHRWNKTILSKQGIRCGID